MRDLREALKVINHRPSDEAIEVLLEKLDVDHDQWVPLDEIVKLAEGEGLGIVISEEGVQELKDDARAAASDAREVFGAPEGDASKSKEKESPKLKKEDVVEG